MAINPLNPQQELLIQELKARETAENSFHEFVKQAWHILEGDKTPFIDGWHIGAMCEHLVACVVHRQIKDLVINVPPRSSKSSIVSVCLPAWVWIRYPEIQFLNASYAAAISIRDSVKCRRLISSNWYQKRWGNRFQLVGDQNTKGRFENSKSGYRIATSVGGSATGEGGNVLTIDDGNNALEGESDIKRQNTNDWYDQVWSTRLHDARKDVKINVQQRIHAQDLSGHILSGDGIVALILPMEYVSNKKCKTIILPSTAPNIWEDPRDVDGELLCPERIGDKELAKLKEGLRTQYRISGQLQQSPAPEGGGIIKKTWFKWYKKSTPPMIDHTILSIDTALEAKEENAYSAALTFGLFRDDYNVANLILLSMFRARLEYPELRKIIQRMTLDYRDDDLKKPIRPDGAHKPDVVLIEAKASGISLIQDLMRGGIIATRFDPSKFGDKIQRVRQITHLIENGKIWIPAKPPDYTRLRPFADLFTEECGMFPASDSRDIVDCLTQCLLRLHVSGWLVNTYDEDITDTSVKPLSRPLY